VYSKRYDAIIVGSGPNGLAAGIVLARKGLKVLILEAGSTIGGGLRTVELTLPGFRHDPCSAIHPTAHISPFLKTLPLADFGLSWCESPLPLTHPMDDGSAVRLERSVDATAAGLGDDADAYRRLMTPLARHAAELFDEILRPLRLTPRHPLLLARFGLHALRSATSLAKRFRGEEAKALFAGCAAHAILPLGAPASASFGLVLALAAHAVGWPFARGGAAEIARALAAYFASLGGEIRTGFEVRSIRDLPPSKAVIFDVTPRQLATIAGDELPRRYVEKLRRFRYSPGAFKVDWAFDGPIPWRAADCSRSATLHLGATLDEMNRYETAVWTGEVLDKPYVLVAQQSLFDDTRAPAGKHTGWAYCHVPNGSTADMTAAIEAQMERFAPGFGARILARRSSGPAQLEARNANLVGGDIGGGANNLVQFLMRPFPSLDPYATPNPRIFIGSSSTPPGGGVHGMCGYWAAQSVLRRWR
jgi:phytoene dehydrogenase-like protein